MHMILTGDTISAQEAEQSGLVSKLYPANQVLDHAIDAGE